MVSTQCISCLANTVKTAIGILASGKFGALSFEAFIQVHTFVVNFCQQSSIFDRMVSIMRIMWTTVKLHFHTPPLSYPFFEATEKVNFFLSSLTEYFELLAE